MTDFFDWMAIISGFITIFYIVMQFNLQKQKYNAEYLIQLHREFYNDSKIMKVFEFLDSENPKKVNEILKKIINEETNERNIDGIEIDIRETDLNIFMNYLNTVAILVEEGSIKKELVYKLFKYQISQIFVHNEIIRYMEKYNFERIKKILPQKFFFYGTLMNSRERLKIEGVNQVNHFLESSDKPYELEGHALEFVEIDEVSYPILISNSFRDDNSTKVHGRLVKIENKANWSALFGALDEYEGDLYKRSIIELPKRPFWGLNISMKSCNKDFAFVYTKV